MRIIVKKNYDEMSAAAARIVAGQIYLKPNSILGLATGSTPEGMYKELIRVHKEVGLDFSSVISFNLDEYVGIKESDPNSYHYFMDKHLFNHINIKRENIYVPDGNMVDVEQECKNYDALIEEKGGIDLQILGIGNNAHIGFNEPDVKFEAITHKVKLDEGTIAANARFFASADEVPRHAISMGIKTIMRSRKVILMASGANKAKAVRDAIYGPIRPETPASILQLHQDVTVIVDEDAAKELPKN